MKKIIIGLCAALMLLTGCTASNTILSNFIEKSVVFRQIEEMTDDGKITMSEQKAAVPIEDIKEYISNFYEYNALSYKNTLTEDEQLIYDSIIYMLEHDYEMMSLNFEMDITSERLRSIYEMVALDDPSIGIAGVYGTIKDSVAVYSIQSNPNVNAQNLLALEEAYEIVESFQFTDSDLDYDKAYIIYEYLSQNVKYPTEINEDGEEVKMPYMDLEKTTHLYSALVEKITNCEGFSNAYSLLCNMAGMNCYESAFYLASLEEYYDSLGLDMEGIDGGHVWNVVTLKSYRIEEKNDDDKIEYMDCLVDVSSSSGIYESTGRVSEFDFCFDINFLMSIELIQKPVREITSAPVVNYKKITDEEEFLDEEEFIINTIGTNKEIQILLSNELDKDYYVESLAKKIYSNYGLKIKANYFSSYSDLLNDYIVIYVD